MEKVLLNWSGGFDSTAMLLDLLSSNIFVYVHHNVLKNNTKRYLKESEACGKVLAFLSEQGFKNFEVIETIYEQPDSLEVPYDCYLHLGYISGVICKTYNISRIYHPITKNDFDLSGASLLERAEESLTICKIVSGLEHISIETPYLRLTKKEVYFKIPKTLRKSLWSCRIPVNGFRCGTCTACIDQNSLLIADLYEE